VTRLDQALKRLFDFLFALLGLLFCWPLILVCWSIAAIETRGNGFFIQERVGRHGRTIRVIKIKTMHPPRCTERDESPIAALHTAAITRSGVLFRRCKFDELPQLFNVLKGDMSFVGPRPDVTGYADRLCGADREILLMRPGITGPASLKYRDEEALLAASVDPVSYNDKVIWPDKVRINRAYYHEYSLLADVRYIVRTVFH
jgi:lipopolysaccharide/colanic/teichoic acid biosynthesis glycosyltransferase